MATKRISPGIYEVDGKRVTAKTADEAEKKAGKSGKSKNTEQNQSGKSTDTVKLSKDAKSVLKNTKEGQALTNLLGIDKPLSTIGTELPEDQKAYIEAVKSLTDPSSASFVGKRSDEEKGALAGLQDLVNKSSQRTPEEQKALSSLEGILSAAGQRSAETSDLLSQMKNRVATAGNRSAEMQDTLNLMKSGLAGLNAQENQALREQAQKEVDRKYQSAIEDFQNQSRLSGMGGASRAGLRNARRDALGAQADLEQKNLLNNVNIQDQRRQAYANTLGSQETSENQRYMDAINAYRNQLSGTEQNEFNQRALASQNYASGVNDFTNNLFNRQSTAANNYAGQVNTLGQNERARVTQALGNYGNALTDRNNYFLDTTKTNLGQERTDRAALTAAALGFAGLTESQRAKRKANAKKSGDGRTNPNGANANTGQYGGFPGQAEQDLYNSFKSIYGM